MGFEYMDEMVLATQQWVNQTYGSHPGYEPVEETGKTGWSTMYALTRGLQIELGITTPVDSFGPTTLSLLGNLGPISTTSNTNPNIVKIIQGGLYCKGYGPGGITGTFGSGTSAAISSMQADLGLLNPDGVVTPKLFKALLTMDAYVLLTGGSIIIRSIQQWLNRKYIHRANFFYMPCDGLYSRNTQKALVYAIQYEEGLSDAVANGNFGPTTQNLLPTLNVGDIDSSTSFVHLFQAAMIFNNYEVSFDGVFSSAMSDEVRNFQGFAMLSQTGTGNFQTWASLLVSTGDPTRQGTACDCITMITPERALALKNAGYTTVGRYLTNASPTGLNKKIQPGELENIFAAGLTVFPIYQTLGSSASYFNATQGSIDAQAAYDAAKSYGFKNGTTIYFAVDFDAYGTDITNNIFPHFKAINEQMIRLGCSYKIGVYGPRNVCIQVSNKGWASTSFVSGMSTGFSGNLGYPLPVNWAFDQISTISVGSGEGYIEIDNNIKSDKDHGASEFGIPTGINELFLNQLEQIQNLANQYTEGDIEAANELVTDYFRYKSNYKGDIWTMSCGPIDTEFISYVDNSIGANEFILAIDPVTKGQIDSPHMFATISGLVYYPVLPNQLIFDLLGWGGDLFTVAKDVYNNRDSYSGDIYEKTYQAAYDYIGKVPQSDSEILYFSSLDFLADIDAVNISKMLQENKSITLFTAVKEYYKEKVSTRFTRFFENRFINSELIMSFVATEIMNSLSPDIFLARQALRGLEEVPYYTDLEGVAIAFAFTDKIINLVSKENI